MFIDMLGVKLYPGYAETRRENGLTLCGKIGEHIRAYRSGKFIPLTLRLEAINTFVLSKIWYRTANVNLLKTHIKLINSSIKL